MSIGQSATYKLELDTRRDGTYSWPIDDVSAYLISAFWNEGMGASYDEFAQPAKLSVTLRNINGEFTSEALGSQLLSNNTFATWSADNPSNWTVTGESGTNPEVSEVGAAQGHGGAGTGACNLYTTSADVSISQAVLTPGTTYQITVTVSNVESGAVQVKHGGALIGYPMFEPGVYTFYFNAKAATTSVYIQNWYACDVTLSSVTVKATALYQPLLRMGTLGRLKATYNGTTTTMFIGRLTALAPTQGQASVRQIVLQFDDPMIDMQYGDYKPKLLTNTTVDAAIAPVFNEAKVAFPYSHAYWMLGVPGCSELGVTTKLFTPMSTNFDTGYTTIAFIGDVVSSTGVGVSPSVHIQQHLAAEGGGRFFFNPRTGSFDFHNRNRDTLNTTVTMTLTERDFESDKSLLSKGTALENQCTITFQPREEGAAGTVLWSASNVPITLKPGETYTTTAKFQDINNGNNRIAAKDIITPSKGIDVIITTLGGSTTGKYDVGFTYTAGTGTFNISNRRGGRRIITTLQVRGTPIKFYDTRSVVALNGASVRDTQLAPNSLSIPVISDEAFAQSYADYRVSKFGTPSPHFESIGFWANNSAARMTNALTRTIGTRFTVTESWSGHDADYILVGMRHRVMIGGDNQHETTYVVKPISRETFWVLGVAGYSELGETTKITF